MDALRKIIVQLDFVNEAGGEIIASTITYVGFVGALTGVRKGLSLSLNFRPTHDASTRLANYRFYFHHVMVLLGLRPSISSLLRQYLLPSHAGSSSHSSSPALADIERDLPSQLSTAAYLIFSDGDRTITMEKDCRKALVRSAHYFIVATNHDIAEESPQNPHLPSDAGGVLVSPRSNTFLKIAGMEDLVEESITRKKCVYQLWYKAINSKSKKSARRAKQDVIDEGFVSTQAVCEWMDVYPIVNEETHFAVVMDPREGKVVWVKRYLEPVEQ